MSFDTTTFLFLFLPAVLIIYFLVWGIENLLAGRDDVSQDARVVSTTGRNAVLLVASLFFYAWGEPVYVLLLLGSSFVAWIGGLLFDHWRGQRAGFVVTVVTISLLVLSLGVFKYLGFLITNVNRIPHIDVPVIDLRLPIGISFFTFQILSYIIDLYRGSIKVQRNPLRLLLYVSLFPQLIAGPIVRYSTVEQELTARKSTSLDIYEGTLRFIFGLSKKILIADNVARFSDVVYGIHINSGTDEITGTTAMWVAALAYTLQLYFDFSGYSDMAIGLGQIFGFHFLENFNYPYISSSITEFWRRWHISLSGWFRDYVYIPLGGNRRGLLRQLFNIMVVWMLTGLWHGAAWNFVLWGLYYGVLLTIEKMWKSSQIRTTFHRILHLPYSEEDSSTGNTVLQMAFSGVRWTITFAIVNIGWVLFHVTSMGDIRRVLYTMISWHPTDWLRLFAVDSDIYLSLPYILLGVLFSFPVFSFMSNSQNIILQTLRPVFAILLLILCIVFIYSSSFHPFIYFRF